MAVTPLGACAPDSLLSTTRKRRNHGVFTVGTGLASVYSSRRETCASVAITLSKGSVVIGGAMTPTQARAMAHALFAAAAAVEAQVGAR